MNVPRTIKLLSTPMNGVALERAARDLGHELPRQDHYKLARFRMRASAIDADDSYRAGYIAALLAVTSAFMAATED